MKKSAHQIWKEAKELKLTGEALKKHLREYGLIVPKEDIDKSSKITNKIIKPNKSK